MRGLAQLKEELEGLVDELDHVCHVPDAVQQPEVSRARTLVDQARSAVASAFLSRRALVVAREAVASARDAVTDAIDVSRVLRERSHALRKEASEIRAVTKEVLGIAAILSQWTLEARGEVILDSAIPPDHPYKQAIEAGIHEVLARAGGRWRVWITLPLNATWWGLRVHGPAIEWVATLQDASEQTPSVIVERLAPLAHIAVAEARYRRNLRTPRGGRNPGGGSGEPGETPPGGEKAGS